MASKSNRSSNIQHPAITYKIQVPFRGFKGKSNTRLLFVVCYLLFTSSCGIYSFTGASISPDVKTVSVSTFPNYAPIVAPMLSQSFTEALKDKFLSQTSLSVIEKSGDLHFEGAITGYAVKPISISGNETAAQKRLTVTIKVDFTNKIDEKSNFSKSFSRYTDFDSNVNLSDVEEELIEEINEMLVEDIFNEAVVNW